MTCSPARGCCAGAAPDAVGPSRARRRWRRSRPNQVWPADFKGQFKTGDGRYCYPLDRHGSLQPHPVGVSGPAVSRRAPRPCRVLSGCVSRGRPAGGDPDRQRRCRSRPPASRGLSALERLVDAAGDRAPTHRARAPAAKWDARTDASRAQTRDHAAGRRRRGGPSNSRFDCVSRPLQPRTPARSVGRSRRPASRWAALAAAISRAPTTPPAYPAALECRRIGSDGTFSWEGRAVFSQRDAPRRRYRAGRSR